MTFTPAPTLPRDPNTALPTITLGIVTMTPKLCREAIALARKNASRPLRVHVYANACDCSEVGADLVIDSPTNTGVVPGMHALYESTQTDLFACIHDDLEIYEPGWDERVAWRFVESPECVLVGFGGAVTLGRPDLYESESECEPSRGLFASNLTAPKGKYAFTSAEAHGPRIKFDFRAVTFDGFGLVADMKFLRQLGGFKWWNIIHHGFDHALSCQAARQHKEVWICPIAIGHPHIGLTSQRPDGLARMAKEGGNYALFLRSLKMLRDEFRDVLPLALPGERHPFLTEEQARPILDGYFGNATDTVLDAGGNLYLDLIERSLTGDLYGDPSAAPWTRSVYDPALREVGKDWPRTALTMVGRKRLQNLRACIEDVLRRDVPGDLIETGVWRGGASIFARAVLKAHGIEGRTVWVADSFQGLPPPDPAYPADANDAHHTQPFLAVALQEVSANFDRYRLLDEQVEFVPGWFKDTLHKVEAQRFSVIRLDGDMYQSTWEALEALYPRLSTHGYCIIDDYYEVEGCRKAVTDYRRKYQITDQLMEIDGSGVFWKCSRALANIPKAGLRTPPITLVIPTLSKQGAERTLNLAKLAPESVSVCVIDNGGHLDVDGLLAVRAHTPKQNLGVAGSWNYAIEQFPNNWLIFLGDDVLLQPDSIQRLVTAAQGSRDAVFVGCELDAGWPFCLIKPRAWQVVGKFDEQFYPAYGEDTDFMHRMKVAGLRAIQTPTGATEPRPGSTMRELGENRDELRKKMTQLYITKWGGPPGRERSPKAPPQLQHAPHDWKRKSWQ